MNHLTRISTHDAIESENESYDELLSLLSELKAMVEVSGFSEEVLTNLQTLNQKIFLVSSSIDEFIDDLDSLGIIPFMLFLMNNPIESHEIETFEACSQIISSCTLANTHFIKNSFTLPVLQFLLAFIQQPLNIETYHHLLVALSNIEISTTTALNPYIYNLIFQFYPLSDKLARDSLSLLETFISFYFNDIISEIPRILNLLHPFLTFSEANSHPDYSDFHFPLQGPYPEALRCYFNLLTKMDDETFNADDEILSIFISHNAFLPLCFQNLFPLLSCLKNPEYISHILRGLQLDQIDSSIISNPAFALSFAETIFSIPKQSIVPDSDPSHISPPVLPSLFSILASKLPLKIRETAAAALAQIVSLPDFPELTLRHLLHDHLIVVLEKFLENVFVIDALKIICLYLIAAEVGLAKQYFDQLIDLNVAEKVVGMLENGELENEEPFEAFLVAHEALKSYVQAVESPDENNDEFIDEFDEKYYNIN